MKDEDFGFWLKKVTGKGGEMNMLEESPISDFYLAYLDWKYGEKTAPIGLLTLCSVASAQIASRSFPIGFNLCKVAPSGAFKTRTSNEAMQAVPKSYYLDLKSDFTLHSIHHDYRGDVRNKCLFVNDGTLLLGSKAQKAKQRIINGLAEVLSDGIYRYADFRESWNIMGPCTCVFNITPESFRMYESTLFASTFIFRFLPVHYRLPQSEQYELRKRGRIPLRLRNKIYVKEDLKANDISWGQLKDVVLDYGVRWSALAGFTMDRMADQVEALVKAHAALNKRTEIVGDDVWLLQVTEPYVSNPLRENASKIRELHQQGKSVSDICLLLGKDPDSYKTTVSRVLNRARMDGLID